MKERIFCKMCKTQTDLTIDSFSRYHLKKYHNIGMKEYYDMFIRKDGEGICPECGKETKFESYYREYRHFCSVDCGKSSKLTTEKISKSFEKRDVKKEAKKRSKTVIKKYGVSHISKLDTIKKKVKKTCLDKFGVETNLLTKECHDKRWDSLNNNKETINEKRRNSWTEEKINIAFDKREKTCLDKYGVKNVSHLECVNAKIRKTNEEHGRWLSKDEYSLFYSYQLLVRRLSRKWYKQLFDNFDGCDYYTREKLICNNEFDLDIHKNNNVLQPTVDHKISVYWGFKNGISPEEISNINNLCVCSRSTNSKKNFKCEEEFKELLEHECKY